MKYCCSKEQFADLFTKSLAKERFEELREMIGMSRLESRGSVENAGSKSTNVN